MQGSLRKNLFEWQFSVSVIPHHFLRSAQIVWWSGRLVLHKQLWISHIPLRYVHGSHLWLMAPAGMAKFLQCCAFWVYESPENHRAAISRPTFQFMVLNEDCKLPPVPCGLWPDQTMSISYVCSRSHAHTSTSASRSVCEYLCSHSVKLQLT